MLSIEERRAARKAFARQVRQEHASREVVTISPPLPEGRIVAAQRPPVRVAIATPVLYVGGAARGIAATRGRTTGTNIGRIIVATARVRPAR